MTWTIDPRKFGDQVKITHRQLCIVLALKIDARLVQMTPVKTGRARSNWLASIGKPDRSTLPGPTGPAEERPPGIGPVAQAAIAAAQAVILSAPEFPLIYLSNNLPYIQRLNDGSSKQAPEAFVESAIDIETSVFR